MEDRSIQKKAPLPDEDNVQKERRNQHLCRLIKENGDEAAVTELILGNEKLIEFVIKRVTNSGCLETGNQKSFDEDDMKQVGRIALYDAAKGFDPGKNVKFSTYAYKIIKNSIGRYVGKSISKKEYLKISEDPPEDYEDEENEEGAIEARKWGLQEWVDISGNQAVLNVTIQKMINRLTDLSLREKIFIVFLYKLGPRSNKNTKETAEYFHLSVGHAKKMEKDILKKMNKKMDDGKIV